MVGPKRPLLSRHLYGDLGARSSGGIALQAKPKNVVGIREVLVSHGYHPFGSATKHLVKVTSETTRGNKRREETDSNIMERGRREDYEIHVQVCSVACVRPEHSGHAHE